MKFSYSIASSEFVSKLKIPFVLPAISDFELFFYHTRRAHVFFHVHSYMCTKIIAYILGIVLCLNTCSQHLMETCFSLLLRNNLCKTCFITDLLFAINVPE